MNERTSPVTGRLVAGVALVALGALWTLDNLGLADASAALRWWPALIVAYGLAKITGAGCVRRPIAGGVIALVGVLLLGGNLGWGRLGLGLFWPLALIALGIQIVMRRGTPAETRGAVADTGERIRSFALMGAASTRSLSQSLRTAELSAVMGGVELDLRDARPADGRVLMDVFAFMGGIDVIVPADWQLELEAAPVMGAIQDERAISTDLAPTAVLVVRGAVILGGLVLRSSPAERPTVRVGVVDLRGRRSVVAGVRVGRVEFGRRDSPDDPAGGASPAPPRPSESR